MKKPPPSFKKTGAVLFVSGLVIAALCTYASQAPATREGGLFFLGMLIMYVLPAIGIGGGMLLYYAVAHSTSWLVRGLCIAIAAGLLYVCFGTHLMMLFYSSDEIADKSAEDFCKQYPTHSYCEEHKRNKTLRDAKLTEEQQACVYHPENAGCDAVLQGPLLQLATDYWQSQCKASQIHSCYGGSAEVARMIGLEPIRPEQYECVYRPDNSPCDEVLKIVAVRKTAARYWETKCVHSSIKHIYKECTTSPAVLDLLGHSVQP